MIIQAASQNDAKGYQIAVMTLHSLLTPYHDEPYLTFYNKVGDQVDDLLKKTAGSPKKPDYQSIEGTVSTLMFEELMKLLDRTGKLQALPMIAEDEE